jgi:hypothetical protein
MLPANRRRSNLSPVVPKDAGTPCARRIAPGLARLSGAALLLGACVSGAACATRGGPREELRHATNLVPTTLRFDRCRQPGESFPGVDLAAVGTCLRSLREPATVRYRLRRRELPWLELQDPDRAPECLRQALARLPVPRTLMFQSHEEGRLACYHAALDLRRDEVLGAKVPFRGQWVLSVSFPLEAPPSTPEDTVRLLAAWAITPIWRQEGEQPRVEIVPERLCQRCLGESGWRASGSGTATPPSWPDESPEMSSDAELDRFPDAEL